MQNTSRDYVNSLPLVLPLPSQREQTIVGVNCVPSSRGEVKSDCLIVLLAVILQRDAMVNKTGDIKRLLKRRMDQWIGLGLMS